MHAVPREGPICEERASCSETLGRFGNCQSAVSPCPHPSGTVRMLDTSVDSQSPRWCLSIAAALCSLALWSPVICLAVLFLWLGITSLREPANNACERPLAVWAIAGGSLFSAAAVVWLCGAAVSAGSNLRARPLARRQPSILARMFPGKTAFEALSALRDASPSVYATTERAIHAVLIVALAVWLALGAAWVWPLHDAPNHCSAALVSISFYSVFGLVAALVVVATAACVAAACLAVCGMSVRNAVDGVVEMLHGVLALSEGGARREGEPPRAAPESSTGNPSPAGAAQRGTEGEAAAPFSRGAEAVGSAAAPADFLSAADSRGGDSRPAEHDVGGGELETDALVLRPRRRDASAQGHGSPV
jgi:hypothetical protein